MHITRNARIAHQESSGWIYRLSQRRFLVADSGIFDLGRSFPYARLRAGPGP